ncbi:hypothetical protein ANN_25189 [Periplaneta americana]|uniref:Uncharacterized protein n=1 Tax=Periplaneta americana TaxID=6978 RepID=A0ABQ8S0M2_PERAM|nr:hypothetical protein ANN_25189 [Periplaneta americana]
MAGLCEGGNEPPDSLKASLQNWATIVALRHSSDTSLTPSFHPRVIDLVGERICIQCLSYAIEYGLQIRHAMPVDGEPTLSPFCPPLLASSASLPYMKIT